MAKHTLKLDDSEIILVREALTEFKRITEDVKFTSYADGVLAKIKASWDKKAQVEKTAKLTRSKEDLAREALIAHIENVLFNPASRSEDAKDFRQRFLKGRDKEIPRLKANMLNDAKSFPEPTEEEWEWNGERPDYWKGSGWHPWYSGRVGGLPVEISFNKSASKVTRVYVEID